MLLSSVHNIRIERLWVDVTNQVGESWADFFYALELSAGLNQDNESHIWLLHHLFLPLLNCSLAFFAESWNEHKIAIRGGPRHSPADLFGFDMLVHGVRGDFITEGDLNPEELEVYGVNWEVLENEQILVSRDTNNDRSENWTSWIDQDGQSPHLNEVIVEPPQGPLSEEEVQHIDNTVSPYVDQADTESRFQMWYQALALARDLHPDIF